jgi:hypothetical protein
MKIFLVSAIVSTYNSEFFIRGRIENLLNQAISDQIVDPRTERII